MLATYHQNSVSAVFSLKYSCWELKGWGLFTCKPSPPQVTTARQLIRETPSLMMDASSSRLDPKHISPKNHPETMVQILMATASAVDNRTSFQPAPPPGWWPPWPPWPQPCNRRISLKLCILPLENILLIPQFSALGRWRVWPLQSCEKPRNWFWG